MRSNEALTSEIKNENFIVIIKNRNTKVIRIRKSMANLHIFNVGIKTGKFQKSVILKV
jgi:hypothetical protein